MERTLTLQLTELESDALLTLATLGLKVCADSDSIGVDQQSQCIAALAKLTQGIAIEQSSGGNFSNGSSPANVTGDDTGQNFGLGGRFRS